MPMITVDCHSCKSAHLCPLRQKAKHSLEVFRAFAYEQPAPSCPYHVPQWSRGVEGVIDTERSIAR